MSSIYRRSRDGYYYYQTYIFNPVTKKKDKRIFHSLNTKDESVARKKQLNFDKTYSSLNIPSFHTHLLSFFKRNISLPILLIAFFSIFLIKSIYDSYIFIDNPMM